MELQKFTPIRRDDNAELFANSDGSIKLQVRYCDKTIDPRFVAWYSLDFGEMQIDSRRVYTIFFCEQKLADVPANPDNSLSQLLEEIFHNAIR